MNTAQARQFYVQFLETLYIQRDLERMEQFVAPDATIHPTPPGLPPGLACVKVLARLWMDAFSDGQYTLESFLHEQGHVACRLIVTATHSGTFMGIPATGRRTSLVDHPHFRLENGKIVEFWYNPDMLSVLQQLGAIPAQAA